MKISYREQDYGLDKMHGPRVDWGDVLATSTFYGREEELVRLAQWIVQEQCRVVSLLGLGGIGKSALSVCLMYQLSGRFDIVIFRSLRDAPALEVLLETASRCLPRRPWGNPPSNGVSTSFLLEHFHKTRVLLVLNNLKGLLKEGDVKEHFRPVFEQ